MNTEKLSYRQFVIVNLRRAHPEMTIQDADQKYQALYLKCGRVVCFGGIKPRVTVFRHGFSYTVAIQGANYYQGTSQSLRIAYLQALWRKRFMAHSAEERESFFWDHIAETMPSYVSFHAGMHP